MARHPNRQELSMWLDGAHSELDEHLDACEICAASLDEIGEPDNADLKPALLTLLRPPEDLHERVSAQLELRLQDRRDADLFGSMLGIAVEAGRLLLDDGTGQDDDHD